MTTKIKPGRKSTEFWMALAVALLGGLATVFASSPWAQVAGIVAAAIASLGYGASRAKVKADSYDYGPDPSWPVPVLEEEK